MIKNMPRDTLRVMTATLILMCGTATAEEYESWWSDPLATGSEIHSKSIQSCDAHIEKTDTLTLADAVTLALCHNPQTRQSWANVLTQAARLGSARSAYLPDVTGNVSLQRDITSSSNNLNTTINPSLSLSYLLYDFGAREANNDLTQKSLLATDYTHNSTLQNILFSTIQAYYQVYSTGASVTAAKESVVSTKSSADAATFRYKAGAAAIADQLLAETAYAQAVLKLEQARNQREIAKGTLANVLGLSPDIDFTMPASAPDMLRADFSQSVSSMLDAAKKQRPDLAAATAQADASKANIDYQRAQALPTFTLNAQGQMNRVIDGSSFNNDGSAIGISMHVPLFTGFDRDYQIKAAEQQANAQIAQRQTIENNVLLDVWKSYNNYDTAKHTYDMTDTLITSARKSEQVALGRYKAGAGTITDLLSAQAQLADARQQRVAAEYSTMIAKADLLRSLGQLDEQSIAGLSDKKSTP